ncbi:MAG: DUF4097 family beta strand repeat-containing protein [Vicinamibacterales bacterium]
MTRLLRCGAAIAVLALPSTALAQVYPARVSVKVHTGAYQSRDRARAEQTERTTRTIHVGDGGWLDLGNVAGDITVTRGRGGDATLEIVKTARARTDDDAKRMLTLVNVDVNETSRRAEVRARYGNDTNLWGRSGNLDVSVAYNVTAPEGTRITAESISGGIRITGIKDVSANTVSGDVHVSGADRLGSVKSVSGSVEVDDANVDSLESGNVSGDVTIRRVKARRIEVGSVSGNVLLDGVDCDRVTAHTTSGDVTFTGRLSSNGRYELKSFSGEVHVSVTGGAGFELQANSFSGDVRSDLPIATHGTGDTRHGHHTMLTGTYGDGSAVIQATTFSGSIVIGKK